jgi:hypothetical protein
MDTNGTNNQTIDTRDNQAGPFFLADKDRRNDGEKTRQIIQPEHPHSAPPIQIASGRETEEKKLTAFLLSCRRPLMCNWRTKLGLLGCADRSPLGINQLAAGTRMCGRRIDRK